MAKNRMINTRFWNDTFIADLDALEKLLFLYLITNSYTNICGIYEIPIKQIAIDTGIDRDNLEKVILPRFQKAKKIFYIDGWIYVKNFLKHQKASGNVKLGINNGLAEVPDGIMLKINKIDDTGGTQGGHSLKLKLESELKLESKDILGFWNSYITIPQNIKWPKNTLAAEQGLLMKCKRWTPEQETAARKIYKKGYKMEDIEQAIKNYCNDILERSPSNDYANHRFSLYEFLKQENGFPKYINK